jgi:Raf kinase inhibitor-like YbhB/YbcL family protein
MSLNIMSSAFGEGDLIPRQYTCDGRDVSPPITWTGAPAGTKSLALIADDPDAPAGTWVHWVVYNLPAGVAELHEAIPPDRELKGGGRQGKNDFRKIGYGGPCPPSGTHRYFFKLYALDAELDLEPGATKADVLAAMEGRILAEARLIGKYKRS